MNRRTWLASAVVVILIGVAVGLLYWRGYRVFRPSPASNTATNQTQTNQVQPKEKTVEVFFAKSPQSIDDPTKLFAVKRTTTRTDLQVYSIEQLLAGPTSDEASQGYQSDVGLQGPSTCGDDDFSLDIAGGTATLRFCRQFSHVGEMSDARADQQLKQTLRQFSNIKKIVILNSSGDCEFDLSGLNLCKQ